MGGALGLSVLAHALLLAGWLYGQRAHEAPSSVGQKRGSLTVTLLAPVQPKARPAQASPPADLHTPPPRTAPVQTPTTHEAASLQAAARPATALAALAEPPGPVAPAPAAPTPEAPTTAPSPGALAPALAQANADVASAPAASPPRAITATTAEQPGARFANLFAPIISRPLGRGRWNAPQPLVPSPAESAMQREQAIQGTRQALASRVEALRAQLRATALAGTCQIQVSLERQAAQLDCTDAGDRQRLAALLQGIVNLQTAAASPAYDACLKASATDIQWAPCPISELAISP
ncbi:hypothetical protein [Aquabacterium sp.]|uniref:hypothetical protein n=1 Tax=Aquabacterium sp. TaxID=1872578 RepID=UPI0040384096